jgi:aryl-alcohol dehydrogenase-like predicted oxidoreductase
LHTARLNCGGQEPRFGGRVQHYLEPKAPGSPPALVVGTMNFGKRTTEAESRRIVARALERGLTFFDTANVYNDGESERILGRALGKRRGEAQIATKVGIGRMSHPEGLAPERIEKAIDESLQRLGTDHVELYYFHKPDHAQPLEASVRAMEKLVAAGKVSAWGASNFASWQLVEMTRWGTPRVSQVIYNLLIRQLELEYFRFAQSYRMHTTVYNPLAGGLLAGKPGARFEGNRMYQTRYLNDRMFELVSAYSKVAAELGMSSVELSYAFLASRPEVDSILLGPASIGQLDAGIDGAARTLPPEALEKIEAVHRAYVGTDVSYAR